MSCTQGNKIENNCEGICKNYNQCKGDVTRVHVTGKDGKNWGKFIYCQTAIEEDRKNGFTVKVV